MPKRLRKFIGSVTMVTFVTVYALFAMVLAQARPVQTAAWYVQTLVYARARHGLDPADDAAHQMDGKAGRAIKKTFAARSRTLSPKAFAISRLSRDKPHEIGLVSRSALFSRS